MAELKDPLIAHASASEQVPRTLIVRNAWTNGDGDNLRIEYEERLADGSTLIATWTARPIKDPTPTTAFYLDPGFYTRIVRRHERQEFFVSHTAQGARDKFIQLQGQYPDGVELDAKRAANGPCCWDVTTGTCCVML